MLIKYRTSNLYFRFVAKNVSGCNRKEFLNHTSGKNAQYKTNVKGLLTSTIDYLDGIEYLNSKIEAVYHTEGRAYNTSATTTPSWRYEYNIRDHLGNNRISFYDGGDGNIATSEILQEQHYYPFGMMQEGPWQNNGAGDDSRYTYNGKEWNGEWGLYDYGARWYDAGVGRFTTVDRFASKYSFMTPYQYGANNPVRYIDVNGDSLRLNNIQRSMEDLMSLVGRNNQGRISADDQGNVSVNMEGLSAKKLKRDKGLSLISSLVNSDKKFLYATAEFETFGNSNSILPIGMDNNGIINAASNGKDSRGENTYLPQSGFDGQVAISIYGSWKNADGGDAKRSVLFHELAENYYRANGINYNPSKESIGAHNMAARLEGHYYGNSQPGGANYSKPKYTDSQKSVFNMILQLNRQ